MKQKRNKSQRSREEIASEIDDLTESLKKMFAPIAAAQKFQPEYKFKGQPRRAGAKQRNQHGRTNFDWRFQVRMLAGLCPFCHFNSGYLGDMSVIYRMSSHSVTFRCQHCTLQ
jgi:hypothetical protein